MALHHGLGFGSSCRPAGATFRISSLYVRDRETNWATMENCLPVLAPHLDDVVAVDDTVLGMRFLRLLDRAHRTTDLHVVEHVHLAATLPY